MSNLNRFQAKRDGAHGAVVKDVLTGKIVAICPADPDHPSMARKYAEAAAQTYNELTEQNLKKREKMGYKRK